MSHSEVKAYFNNTISSDLLHLIVGEDAIGVGSTRTVYKYVLDPALVIKVETCARRFQNIIEWETWEILKHYPKYSKWFSPCISISPCGTILVQKYAREPEPNELPSELPVFFADIKRENFGMLNGQLVCVDYGNSFLVDRGLSPKMKKVEW